MSVLYDIIQNIAKELKTVRKVNGYETDIKSIRTHSVNIATLDGPEYPAVIVLADGIGGMEVEDNTQFRIGQEIGIYCAVREKFNNQKSIMTMTKDVKKLLHSEIDLGTGFIGIQYVKEEYHPNIDIGTARIGIIMRYVDSEIKTADPPGTDVYGSNDILHDVLTKLETEMNTLKTAMSSFDPTFSYVYQGHGHADLSLSAVTVGIANCESEPSYVSSVNLTMEHTIDVSIRIHTAYGGGVKDELRNIRLLNGIITYLQTTMDLGDGYDIEEINEVGPAIDFEESATFGGEVRLTIKARKGYAQS